jgi:hypothetical protein
MDREEDIKILREIAEDLERTADNASYKISRLLPRNGARAAEELEMMRKVHRRLLRKRLAVNNAIAAYLAEDDQQG